jgi:hypothetical protein
VKANVVRLATVVVGLVSIVVALVDRIPTDIPVYAFGDALVLRAERGLALLAILFIASDPMCWWLTPPPSGRKPREWLTAAAIVESVDHPIEAAVEQR